MNFEALYTISFTSFRFVCNWISHRIFLYRKKRNEMKIPKYWTIENWYEFDVNVWNYHSRILEDPHRIAQIKYTLEKIDILISDLKQNGLCNSWFFLFEGKCIRIRINGTDRESIDRIVNLHFNKNQYPQQKIRQYREERWKFDCEESVELFARCMNSISEMCIKKLNGDINFDPYRMYERICHCIHINLFGQANETEMLVKRLSERLSMQDHTSIYEKFK